MSSRMKHWVSALVATLLFAVILSPSTAWCVPAFARGQNMGCNACHTFVPQLNETGRQFKEDGFAFANQTSITDDLTLESSLPVSGRLNFRFVDKRTSKTKTSDSTDKDKQFKLRAFHELELFFAGKAGEKWSYFVEFESEDEFPAPGDEEAGFGIQNHTAVGEWRPNEKVALSGGWGNPFYADPYNTLNYHKPVRHAWAPAGILPGNTQFVSLSGRPADKVFFLASFHGNTGSAEGKDARDFSGRVAVDVSPEFSIGAFGSSMNTHTFSSAGADSTDDRTNLFGGDVQFAYDNYNLHGLFGMKSVPAELASSGADETENFWGVEGNALFPAGDFQVGPVVQVSGYTMNDGNDSWVDAGFFFNVNFKQNARAQLGWEGVLSAPDMYTDKESRITLVGDLYF